MRRSETDQKIRGFHSATADPRFLEERLERRWIEIFVVVERPAGKLIKRHVAQETDERHQFVAAHLLAGGAGAQEVTGGAAVRFLYALRHVHQEQLLALSFKWDEVHDHRRLAVTGQVLHFGHHPVGHGHTLDALVVVYANVDTPTLRIGERNQLSSEGARDALLEFQELPLPRVERK
jgi:hypothetical protein